MHSLKLNLGSGTQILKEYHNIDIRYLPKLTVIADVENLPYRANTVDEILALDVYEHISYHDSKDLLKYWVSLLKTGGKLIIQAPCLDNIVSYFMNSKTIQDIEVGIAVIFGGQDYKENTHLTVAQSKLMENYLREAGITGVISFNNSGTNRIWESYK